MANDDLTAHENAIEVLRGELAAMLQAGFKPILEEASMIWRGA
jgi:hypothetical protein